MPREVVLAEWAPAPSIDDVPVWTGRGWEPQAVQRAYGRLHTHTETKLRIVMGPWQSPDYVQNTTGWRIAPDGSAEFNDVTARGTVYADAGKIANWTIATDTITCDSGAVGLNSEATGGVDWRIWAGDTTPGSAPFRVDESGNLVATSATIEGEITATTGEIGGWTITSTELHNTNLWLDAAAKQVAIGSQTFGADGIQLEYNSGDPRAFIGDASYYFKFDGTNIAFKGVNTELTAAGVFTVSNITATGGTIGGWAIAATKLSSANIELDDGNDRITVGGITLDGAVPDIESSNYLAGTDGFHIDEDFAEFGNAAIRGMLSAVVMKYEEVTAVGGSLVVAVAGRLTQDAAEGTDKLYLDEYLLFDVGDTVRLSEGGTTETLTVETVHLGGYLVTTDNLANTWKAGAAVVKWDERILLTSELVNSPYVSVVNAGGTEKARLGCLDGLAGDPSGYGLWSDNVFLEGKITATSGEIAGWTIGATSIYKTGVWIDSSNLYICIKNTAFGSDGIQLDYNAGNPRAYIGDGSDNYFKFDGTDVSWKGANTELTAAGAFTATNATITGAITASSGSFTGVLTIGADGEIRQGSGTLGVDFTGLRIWNDGGIGRIAGYNDDTLQWYASTDGKFYAGGGDVIIDEDGLSLVSGVGNNGYVNWIDAGSIHAVKVLGDPTLNIDAGAPDTAADYSTISLRCSDNLGGADTTVLELSGGAVQAMAWKIGAVQQFQVLEEVTKVFYDLRVGQGVYIGSTDTAPDATGDINMTGELKTGDGAAATPAHSFNNDKNTGIYRITTDTLGFSCGGTERLQISTTEADFSVPVRVDDGSAATPSLAFNSDTNLGFYRIGADNLGLSIGGVQYVEWDDPTSYTGDPVQSIHTRASQYDYALGLFSTDVNHTFTGLFPGADFYGGLRKMDADDGGLYVPGVAGGSPEYTLYFDAMGRYETNVSSTKDGSAAGMTVFRVGKSDGSTGAAALTASKNGWVWQNYGTNAMILSAGGDLYLNATTHTGAWDEHDDVALIASARAALQQRTQEMIEGHRDILEQTGVMTFDDRGQVMLSMQHWTFLLADAIRQMASRLATYEQALLAAPKLRECDDARARGCVLPSECHVP